MREAERIAVGTLLFGPGARLARLHVLLKATSPDLRARQLQDLDELARRRTDGGFLLVDADALPAEDVGYLRRFLARNSRKAHDRDPVANFSEMRGSAI